MQGDREMLYLQSMYPRNMKLLQEQVSRACDEMDYEGSPMFDEYPDRMLLERICDSVCERIAEMMESGVLSEELLELWNLGEMQEEELRSENLQEEKEEDWEMTGQQRRPPQNPPPWGPPSRPTLRPPMWGPPPRPTPRPPMWGPLPRPTLRPPMWGRPNPRRRRRRPDWFRDVIQLLTLGEIHRRRCRNGRC